jgi:hypothetical protein
LLYLVDELKGTVSERQLYEVCDQIGVKGIIQVPGAEARYRACKATVYDKITECDAAKDEFVKDLCKAYIIESKCKDITGRAQHIGKYFI